MIFTSFTLKVNCVLMCSARLHTNMKIKLSRKVRHESEATGAAENRRRVSERQTNKKKRNWIVNRSNDNRMIGANNNTCTHQLHLLRFSLRFLPRFVLVHSCTISFIEFYRMRVCGSDLHFTIEPLISSSCVGFAKRIDGVLCNFKLFHEYCRTSERALLLIAGFWIRFDFVWFIYLFDFLRTQYVSPRNLCAVENQINLHERSANKRNAFQMAPIDFESKKISPQTYARKCVLQFDQIKTLPFLLTICNIQTFCEKKILPQWQNSSFVDIRSKSRKGNNATSSAHQSEENQI